jgi:hypothetical protein
LKSFPDSATLTENNRVALEHVARKLENPATRNRKMSHYPAAKERRFFVMPSLARERFGRNARGLI